MERIIGYRIAGYRNQLSGQGSALTVCQVEDWREWLAIFQGVYQRVTMRPVWR